MMKKLIITEELTTYYNVSKKDAKEGFVMIFCIF